MGVVYGVARDQGLTSASTRALKAIARGVPFVIPFGGIVGLQFVPGVATAFISGALHCAGNYAGVYDIYGENVDVARFISTVKTVSPDAESSVSLTRANELPFNFNVSDVDFPQTVGELPKNSLENGIGE